MVIDVSQSVEQAHPSAMEFLRKDIQNVTVYFKQYGVDVLDTMELFAYVTKAYPFSHKRVTVDDVSVYSSDSPVADISSASAQEVVVAADRLRDDATREAYFTEIETRLERELVMCIAKSKKETELQQKRQLIDEERQRQRQESSEVCAKMAHASGVQFATIDSVSGVQDNDTAIQNEVKEAVFMNSFIPRSLNEFSNPVKEMEKIRKGERETVFESAISELLADETRHEDGMRAGPTISASAPRRIFLKTTTPSVEADSDVGSDDDNDDDDDDSSDAGKLLDEDDDGDGDDDERPGKYRARLPDSSNPDERLVAKAERRAAAKAAKEVAAERRKTKVKKHLKKRAVKAGRKH